jgi:lipopolysaccharide transport system ATP-binding protein
VGDELFQRKCFSRIEAIRARGATILFVSHSGSTIIELCDRAVLMDAGEKLAVGLPKEIVGRYQKLLHAPGEKREIIRAQIRTADEEIIGIASAISHSTSADATSIILHENDVLESFDPNFEPSSTLEYESHGPLIGTPTILTSDGRRVNGLVRGRKYRYCYPVVFNGPATKVRFGMSIKSTTGFSIGGALSAVSSATALPRVEHGKTVKVEFSFYCNLNPGIFFMNAGVFGIENEEEVVLHRRSDVIAFRVLPIQENIETEMVSFNFEAKVSMNA